MQKEQGQHIMLIICRGHRATQGHGGLPEFSFKENIGLGGHTGQSPFLTKDWLVIGVLAAMVSYYSSNRNVRGNPSQMARVSYEEMISGIGAPLQLESKELFRRWWSTIDCESQPKFEYYSIRPNNKL